MTIGKRGLLLISLWTMLCAECNANDTKFFMDVDWGLIQAAGQLAQFSLPNAAPPLDEAYLRVGTVITISKKTRLLPELHSSNIQEALNSVRTIYPGSVVLVKKVAMSNRIPWFEVDVLAKGRGVVASGWINGLALEGQMESSR